MNAFCTLVGQQSSEQPMSTHIENGLSASLHQFLWTQLLLVYFRINSVNHATILHLKQESWRGEGGHEHHEVILKGKYGEASAVTVKADLNFSTP